MSDTDYSPIENNRRAFLKLGSAMVASCYVFSAGCSAPVKTVPAKNSSRNAFEYGVASADPQPNAILLWSRVTPLGKEEFSANVIVQMSKSDDFKKVIVEKTIVARQNHDHTIRILINSLEPDTTYYYRFIASDGAVSRTGRTWTAPSLSSDRKLTVALASCQAFPPSQYGAYRHLINREKREGIRPDVVLHVGDYIYSTTYKLERSDNTGLTGPIPDKPIDVGPGPRSVPPSMKAKSPAASQSASPPTRRPGGRGRGRRPSISPDSSYKEFLESRREIYRRYHLDIDLQDARALYPFVCTWDDHEFGNDVWQSFTGDGARQKGRLAATQAWFEYVPQILSDSLTIDGLDNAAHDFRSPAVPVENVKMDEFDENFLSKEKNNLAAINSMSSYRVLRWGKRADIVITDTRSYRGPGANPTITLDSIQNDANGETAFGGFSLYEGDALYQMAKGRTANNGNPKETLFLKGQMRENPRKNAPETTMLGNVQKEWFKTALKKSNAKWKIWAVASPICSFKFDPETILPGTGIGYNWTDGWDGFPHEREELMDYIQANKIGNVVSLSGDRHAHYAGLVANNPEADSPKYVIPEYTCTGISAFPRWTNMYRSFERLGIAEYAKIEVDGQKRVSMDITMRYGFPAAKAYMEGNIDEAQSLAKHSPNPHLDYADNDAYGYVLATFNEDKVEVDFVTVPIKNWVPEAQPEGPDTRRLVKYETPAWSGGEEPKTIRTSLEGEKLFGDV